MTTGIVTAQLSEIEIRALVEALKHYAFVLQRRDMARGRTGGDSIDGILGICGVIQQLWELSGNCDENFNLPAMVFRDHDAAMAKVAIERYATDVCVRRSGKTCTSCELPYSELPALLRGIIPRLEDNWTQTSGYIPGVGPDDPGTIWIR